MLLLLTGDIQIGKTRWLRACVARLEDAGVRVEGVLAPGVWRPIEPGEPEPVREKTMTRGGAFEKLGIDNELLPSHEVIAFARRQDLARAEGTYDESNQAAKVGMGWHVDDRAVARVNAHFDALARDAADGGGDGAGSAPGLLVVDELGRLELLHGGGLTSAMGLLARGPQGRYAHAVVIARDKFGLNDKVEELFGDAWGGCVRIAPGDEAWTAWLEPLTTR